MGAVLAQLLVPLDFEFFIISRILRIMESLEKHSGISCWLNIAHTLQAWFPYAQAPHHHDWHHEGFKSCNYTFSAIGGVWDYILRHAKLEEEKLPMLPPAVIFLPTPGVECALLPGLIITS